MATTELKRMRQLIGTAAEWAANDLVIGAGEIAFETPAVGDPPRFKVGDGTKRYSELPFNDKPEFISVTDFGAVGGNGALDKAGFLAAATASRSVYVPQTALPFIIDTLNVPLGVRIWGPGRIQTSGGTVIELSQVSFDVASGPMRLMFIESDKQGWEELLDIKACGFTAIMAYLWSTNLAQVIANAEAVGLQVIVHSTFSAGNQPEWAARAATATAYNARASVVGYYVFDEPFTNGISVANQDGGLNYFRALTRKPLSCAEGAVDFVALFAGVVDDSIDPLSTSFSSNYDQVFCDVYYADGYTSANQSINAYLSLQYSLGFASNKAKLTPLVGLFNDTGFAKSKTLTVQLADVIARFSRDGSFGVFAWNAYTAGTYQGVRNVPEYRAAAKRLAATVPTIKPWRVEIIPVGTAFGSASNRLGDVYHNTVDGASPGLSGAPNIVPWFVENVGSAMDVRRQNFTENGLMIKGATARCGFAGMPSGFCSAVLRWYNNETAQACNVLLGASTNLGYTTVNAITQAIAHTAVVAIYKQLDATGRFSAMPTLDVTNAVAVNFPYSWLKGFFIFTDMPEATF